MANYICHTVSIRVVDTRKSSLVSAWHMFIEFSRDSNREPSAQKRFLGQSGLLADMCGFRSKVNSQIVVYHQDGNLNNSNLLNLRSICLDCSELLQKQDSVAQIGDLDLVADD